MSQELLINSPQIATTIGPIVLGVSMGVLGRNATRPDSAKSMAKVCEVISLKMLLPFFLIESIARSPISINSLTALAVGFLLPVLALIGMALYKKLFSQMKFFTPHYEELRFLASTYGGGNRGTVLLVLLFASSANSASSDYFSDYLFYFSLVDLGNFLCLLILISMLLNKHYGMPEEKSRNLLSRLWDNYLVITVLMVAGYFALYYYWPAVESVLSNTIDLRKILFSVFVFWAIALRFEYVALRNFFVDIIAFISARIFAALCVFVIIFLFLPAATPIYISAAILVMMPPSSVLPSMIGQSNASGKAIAYVNGFAGAANVIYIGLIAVGGVVAVSRALQ